MDFVAIDVETANEDYSSICAIGLVSFSRGEIVHKTTILVNPDAEFSPVNIAIHGITPKHVLGCPIFSQAIASISNHLVGATLAHHGPFDRVAIGRACSKANMPPPDFRWLDTMRLTRRVWPQFARTGYGLRNVAEYLRAPFLHHDPAEDARIAGLILIEAVAETQLDLSELIDLSFRPLTNPKKVSEIIPNSEGALYGETIVFTGALTMPRSEAAFLAAQVGCAVRNSITGATSLLVIGDHDVRKLGGKSKSSKQLDAEKLISEGARIRLLSESDFREICAIRP